MNLNRIQSFSSLRIIFTITVKETQELPNYKQITENLKE